MSNRNGPKQPTRNIGTSAGTLTQERSEGAPSPDRKSRAIGLLIVLIAAVLVYGQAAGFDFLMVDDNIHVYTNPHYRPLSLASLLFFFTHSYEKLYIPLSYSMFAALFSLAKATFHAGESTVPGVDVDPHVFHAANVAVHVVNCCLVFLVVRRLFKNDWAALAGALTFALHPLQVESVAWISEMRGLLAGMFSLISVLLIIRSYEPQIDIRKRRLLYAGSMLAFLAAALSKPSAVALPIIVLLILRYFLGINWRSSIRRSLPFALLCIPIIWATHTVQPVPPSAITPWYLRPVIAGDSLWFYLEKLTAPLNLSVFYGRTPQYALSHGAFWHAPAAYALIGLVLFFIDRKPRIRGAFLIFVAGLLPVLGLVPFFFQVMSTVADRYVYLAMLGPALFVAAVAARATQDVDMTDASASRSRLAIACGACVIVAWGALSWLQTGYWKDHLTLFARATQISPESAYAHMGYATGLDALGRKDLAVGEYQKAAQIDPNTITPDKEAVAAGPGPAIVDEKDAPKEARVDVNLGNVLLQEGQADAAADKFRQAIALDNNFAAAYVDLGNVLSSEGRVDDAMAQYRQANAINPKLAVAHSGLANGYLQQKDFSNAIQEYQKALDIEPKEVSMRTAYGIALAMSGRLPDGIAQFREAIKIDPSYKPAQENLQAALQLQKQSPSSNGR